MFLGTTLSVAATWFVLLPAIREKPPTPQTCEVVLLANGTTRCDNGDTLAMHRDPWGLAVQLVTRVEDMIP